MRYSIFPFVIVCIVSCSNQSGIRQQQLSDDPRHQEMIALCDSFENLRLTSIDQMETIHAGIIAAKIKIAKEKHAFYVALSEDSIERQKLMINACNLLVSGNITPEQYGEHLRDILGVESHSSNYEAIPYDQILVRLDREARQSQINWGIQLSMEVDSTISEIVKKAGLKESASWIKELGKEFEHNVRRDEYRFKYYTEELEHLRFVSMTTQSFMHQLTLEIKNIQQAREQLYKLAETYKEDILSEVKKNNLENEANIQDITNESVSIRQSLESISAILSGNTAKIAVTSEGIGELSKDIDLANGRISAVKSESTGNKKKVQVLDNEISEISESVSENSGKIEKSCRAAQGLFTRSAIHYLGVKDNCLNL